MADSDDLVERHARAARRRRFAWTALVVASLVAVIVVTGPWRGDEAAVVESAIAPATRPAVPDAKSGARPRRARGEASESPAPATAVESDEAPGPPVGVDDVESIDGFTGAFVEIVDEEGRPVADGTVTLTRAEESMAGEWPSSFMARRRLSKPGPLFLSEDEDGSTVDATAVVPGCPPTALVRFTVHAKKFAPVRLVATRPRTAQVRVFDRESELPIAGAIVVSETELDRRGGERRGVRATTGPGVAVTDAGGRCLLGDLGAGEHAIEIRSAGHERGKATWTDGPLVVGLVPYHGFGTVIVTVLGSDGAPANGIEVVSCEFDRTMRTDAAGKAAFDATPAGRRLFTVLPSNVSSERGRWYAANAGATLLEDVDVSAGGRSELVLGFRKRTASVTVHVIRDGGAPVVGARVALFGHAMFDATSDTGGDARFPELPSGEFSPIIHVGTDADWHFDKVNVADGAHVERTLTMGAAMLRGRVVQGVARTAVVGAWIMARGLSVGFTSTDREGRFELPSARAGVYRVVASSGGLANFKRSSTGLAARPVAVTVPSDAEVVIEMVESGRIAARFSGSDRSRSGDAHVVALVGEEPSGWFSRATGQDDLLSEDLAPGRYEVEVRFETRKLRYSAEVVAGKAIVVDVKLP